MKLYLALLIALFLASCSSIDEEIRYISSDGKKPPAGILIDINDINQANLIRASISPHVEKRHNFSVNPESGYTEIHMNFDTFEELKRFEKALIDFKNSNPQLNPITLRAIVKEKDQKL